MQGIGKGFGQDQAEASALQQATRASLKDYGTQNLVPDALHRNHLW